MKRLTILFLLIATPLFAQHRALRIDSLEINDKNVTSFFDDYMSDSNNDVLFLDSLVSSDEATIAGSDSCVIITVDDGNGKAYFKAGDGDSIVIYCDNSNAYIKSNNSIQLNNKLLSWASKIYIDSTGIYGMDATDADTFKIYDDGDTTYFHSDNPGSFNSDITFWGTISAATVTDRTEYCGEKEAVKLLKKVNLSTVDKFKNEGDVFVLPYELRDRQYRSLSKCVSLLLAVTKSQQAEIEDLKKQVKRLK